MGRRATAKSHRRTAYGALNTPAELENQPQLRRVEVETPAGAIELVAPLVRMFDELPLLDPDQQGSKLREEFAR